MVVIPSKVVGNRFGIAITSLGEHKPVCLHAWTKPDVISAN
jgi:hypothetical protein